MSLIEVAVLCSGATVTIAMLWKADEVFDAAAEARPPRMPTMSGMAAAVLAEEDVLLPLVVDVLDVVLLTVGVMVMNDVTVESSPCCVCC